MAVYITCILCLVSVEVLWDWHRTRKDGTNHARPRVSA